MDDNNDNAVDTTSATTESLQESQQEGTVAAGGAVDSNDTDNNSKNNETRTPMSSSSTNMNSNDIMDIDNDDDNDSTSSFDMIKLPASRVGAAAEAKEGDEYYDEFFDVGNSTPLGYGCFVSTKYSTFRPRLYSANSNDSSSNNNTHNEDSSSSDETNNNDDKKALAKHCSLGTHSRLIKEIVARFQIACSSNQFMKYCTNMGFINPTFHPNPYISLSDDETDDKNNNMKNNPGFAKFYECLESTLEELLLEDATLGIVFHGTHSMNIVPILQNGLDEARRAGQAYGPGEYFSKEPGISSSYCKGGMEMLVFVVVLPKPDKHPNDDDSPSSRRKYNAGGGSTPLDFVVVNNNKHHLAIGTFKFTSVKREVLGQSQMKRAQFLHLSRDVYEKSQIGREARLKAVIIQHLISGKIDVASEKYQKEGMVVLKESSKKEISWYVHSNVDEGLRDYMFPDLPEPYNSFQELEAAMLMNSDLATEVELKAKQEFEAARKKNYGTGPQPAAAAARTLPPQQSVLNPTRNPLARAIWSSSSSTSAGASTAAAAPGKPSNLEQLRIAREAIQRRSDDVARSSRLEQLRQRRDELHRRNSNNAANSLTAAATAASHSARLQPGSSMEPKTKYDLFLESLGRRPEPSKRKSSSSSLKADENDNDEKKQEHDKKSGDGAEHATKILQSLFQGEFQIASEMYMRHESKLSNDSKKEIADYVHRMMRNEEDSSVATFLFPTLMTLFPPPPASPSSVVKA